MTRNQVGASLVEGMVVIAISSILLSIGLPNFTRFIHSSRTSRIGSDLIADIWHTRSEAVKLNAYVMLCASADGVLCSDAGDWNQGWLSFPDHNGNAVRDELEPVLRSHPAIEADWVVKGNAPVRRYVRYGPNGETSAINGAFQAGTITVCKAGSGPAERIQIVINKVGRPRTTKLNSAVCEA